MVGRPRLDSLSSVEEDDYDTLTDIESDKNVIRTKVAQWEQAGSGAASCPEIREMIEIGCYSGCPTPPFLWRGGGGVAAAAAKPRKKCSSFEEGPSRAANPLPLSWRALQGLGVGGGSLQGTWARPA